MTQEDRELLLKDLCARLPYGVKAQVYGYDEEKGEVEVPLKIYSINTDGYVYFETNEYDVNYISVEECRLYFRPMSSMTEEEKEELLNLLFDKEAKYFYIDEEGFIDGKTSDLMKEGLNYPAFCPINIELYTDFLLSHHFDYRGLIEKGLALEAPEEMYSMIHE